MSFAIHQFHSNSAYGDGVTNSMFYIQKILIESGYRSEIYCVHIDQRLKERIHSFTEYEDNPNDAILIHYSLGTDHDDWITKLRSRKILFYHNITPIEFFREGDGLRKFIQSGRTQLAAWARERIFVGQIAASDYNALELRRWGYDRIETISALVDLDRLRAHPWNPEIGLDAVRTKTLLFVGRICEHKSQLELVEMMRCLAAISPVPTRLLLVGGVASEAYEAELLRAIERLGVAAHVRLLGRLEDDDVYGLYRRADLYVSMSLHEGFGMPLLEAMTFGLPVLARAAGSVAETLGEGGLILEEHGGARAMAAAARLMLEEPALRMAILDAQRRSVARYERAVVGGALERHLRQLGFEVALNKGGGDTPPALWTIQGPYDSSYSLAIVNRELARGLERTGERMALESRDGPGAFAPSEAFLAAHPDVAAMAARANAGGRSAVSLRNQYPPHVADMRGDFRALANYAWEESGFPPAWVDEFNASLDLITVTSRFVAKTLRDNGVHTPIEVVGNGVDHMFGPTDEADKPVERGAFRFLHVSSCFPRKGVDALLAAWAQAFDVDSGVELVIKTFANPHNMVAADLEALRDAHPRHAPISLIVGEWTAAEMRALYESADCVVCPSRGEGFSLPLAEAAALGKPVVTTAYGGQSDFCTLETGWLCDFSFAPAGSHLGLPDSVWVEPDVDSLAQALVDCRDAAPEERARRAEAARQMVTERYHWDRVAQATRAAIAAVRREGGEALRLPRIGWVSTWGSRCGIATYSEALAQAIEPERLFVFADRGSTPLKEDPAFVERCWAQGWKDPLDELLAAILARGLDAVVIQFNFGFFALKSLSRLLCGLKSAGVIVCLFLHATTDVFKPGLTIRLAEIAPALATVDRVLVHSVPDLNRLKTIGLVDNVTLFPHGLPRPLPTPREALRRRFFPDADPVVACFGFLLPNKGVRELIRAFARLRRDRPKAHLLLLTALYPVAESQEEHDACKAEIAAAGLKGAVTFDVDFLDEETILARLGAADVVVYPYQHTEESASGAIRLGLASRTPVARTPLAIFSDVDQITYELLDGSSEAIAEGLAGLLADRRRLQDLARRQDDWLQTHSWARLSRRLADLVRGEARMRRLPKL
jgi:glycosyltransferase involved in cell wall biosynthesis